LGFEVAVYYLLVVVGTCGLGCLGGYVDVERWRPNGKILKTSNIRWSPRLGLRKKERCKSELYVWGEF